MAQRDRYRLLTGKHCRSEPVGRDGLLEPVIYRQDEEIRLTAGEAERLRGRVERIGAASAAPAAPRPTPRPEPETEPTDNSVPEYGLADLPWSDAAAVISGLDTVEEVEAARAEEVAGKGRKGVIKAADERLAELGV